LKIIDGVQAAPAPGRERQWRDVLTPDAVEFLAGLHRRFEPRRRELLALRAERAGRFAAGEKPAFLAGTASVRAGAWKVAGQPADLRCRRVEITGPTDRKMMINALNSGADVYMADFEDSNAPTFANLIDGQANLREAVRRTIAIDPAPGAGGESGRAYRLGERTATLMVRPRGLHLTERNLLIDGERVSGALFDFALFFFHNARELLSRASGPYFYLPKLESHLEARWWNEVFVAAQAGLGIAQGSVRATVLIETLPAAFEMDEILFELREHSAGLNAGRWDYIFSCIKKLGADPAFCLADRARVTMTAPFLRSYALLLIRTCHHRGAAAIGGMSALIPIRDNPEANARALAGVRADKAREATDGCDGAWVAHPALVAVAMQEFTAVLGDRPNQYDRQREDVEVTAADLLAFGPAAPITEGGLRANVRVGIHYIGAWLAGNGCVPIDHLMEDAATAEISRSQVWQWIRSPAGVLEDGRKVDGALVRAITAQELARVFAEVGPGKASYERAARVFLDLTLAKEFAEFLTTGLYEELCG
jgi:malate synthase